MDLKSTNTDTDSTHIDTTQGTCLWEKGGQGYDKDTKII